MTSTNSHINRRQLTERRNQLKIDALEIKHLNEEIFALCQLKNALQLRFSQDSHRLEHDERLWFEQQDLIKKLPVKHKKQQPLKISKYQDLIDRSGLSEKEITSLLQTALRTQS